MNMNPFLNGNDLKSFVEQFTNPIGGSFPLNDIQKQIEETISQALPDFLKGDNGLIQPTTREERGNQQPNPNQNPNQNKKKNPTYQLFETHDYVILRVPLDKQSNVEKIKISLNSYQVKIKFNDDPANDLTVSLPVPVKPKQTKSSIQDGILEIQMLKRGQEPMTEISLESNN